MGKKKKPQTRAGGQGVSPPSATQAVIAEQERLWDAAKAAAGCTASQDKGAVAPSEVEERFSVRRVQFLGRKVPMLLQSRNGPCPLLAVANGLLLRGHLSLSEGQTSLSSRELLQSLSDMCSELSGKAADEDANVKATLENVKASMPRMLEGVGLNCRFSACDAFEYTPELALFDLLKLNLYHVWVAPPEVTERAASWNALAETLATCAELRDEQEQGSRRLSVAEEDRLAEGLLLEQWYQDHLSQATPLGLQQLASAVKEREVCVLFRNNHFCTVYRPCKDLLCSLLTDISLEDVDDAVWESVELDCSTGRFLRADFKPFVLAEDGSSVPRSSAAAGGSGPSDLSPEQEDAIRSVQELGFSRDQALAALISVDWSGPEDAVDALLDDRPGRSEDVKGAAPRRSTDGDHACPTCGKSFKSLNGMLNHRTSRSH